MRQASPVGDPVVFYGAPVTGLLSPLTSVSPATSLLKTVVVSAHARRTAAMATCCSRRNGTGMIKSKMKESGTDHDHPTTNRHQLPSQYNNALTAKHPPPSSVSKTKKKKTTQTEYV